MSDERDALIEQVAGAFRERIRAEIRSHPGWYDLDDEGRIAAWERALATRDLEAALDPEGLSSTARAVLSRIPR